MKKIIALLLLSAVFFSASAQKDSLRVASYKRFPSLPPINLLLVDSVSTFTKDNISKKKPTMIMLFSPDCDHCQHETEEIIKHMDEFKKIQIVMATTLPFDKMKEFYAKYNLKRFENITMGRDTKFVLPVFYDIRNLPFLAFYDKKGALIDSFEGSLPVEKVLEKFKE